MLGPLREGLFSLIYEKNIIYFFSVMFGNYIFIFSFGNHTTCL